MRVKDNVIKRSFVCCSPSRFWRFRATDFEMMRAAISVSRCVTRERSLIFATADQASFIINNHHFAGLWSYLVWHRLPSSKIGDILREVVRVLRTIFACLSNSIKHKFFGSMVQIQNLLRYEITAIKFAGRY